MEKNPDILILLECTKSSFDIVKNNGWKYKNWYNDDLNDELSELGVAIFSKEYQIEFTENFNRNYRYVIPYKIKYDLSEFILFATWTKAKSKYSYEENIIAALDDNTYKKYFDGDSLIIGDFNTATTEGNKEDYKKIIDKGLINNVNSKDEYKNTYAQGNGKYYVNDYCLSSKQMNKKYDIEVNIEDFDVSVNCINKYESLSDHCPLLVEVNKKKSGK